MPSFCLPTFRLVRRAIPVATLTLLFGIPVLAQLPSSDDKLDAVLALHAEQRTGRSRVIVEFKASPDVRAITSRRGRPGRRLSALRLQVAEIDHTELAALAADSRVARVFIDRPIFATLSRTASATGAAIARQQFDVCGRNVGVAVVDSGFTLWHNDLNLVDGLRRTADAVRHFKDFTQETSGGGTDQPSDGYGHGTHVAGSIAGSGHDSDGKRTGIAPCAHLIGLKVLDDEGHGYISDVIAALDYAVANKDAFNIRVINLSVASGVFESHEDDPLAQAARRAVDAGIVVIAAAGNLGVNERGETQFGGVTSPGNSPSVITVGASSHQGTARRSDDTIGSFSSRGPTAIDWGAKPDLVAPGVGIESTADPHSMLYATHDAYLLEGSHDVGAKPYLSLSGTSMAAPVVTGVVALMLEANPDLTPNAVKAILQYTAQIMDGESALAQGAGLVNAAGAIRMARFFAARGGNLGATADVIEGEVVPWSRQIIWGNFRVTGGMPLPGANAWTMGLPWGAKKVGKKTPVVWGARIIDKGLMSTAGEDNIVWATSDNIVWATGGRDNIVWATGGRDNIVWATGGGENIVWATSGRENIVWATGGRDNIVWATKGRDNIVWATADQENIVWATAIAQNLVWGNECGGRDCTGKITAASKRGLLSGIGESAYGTLWATAGSRNIVWATGGARNIVWATGAETDGMFWTAEAPLRIVWPAEKP